jgi:hypothetical protein
MRERAERQRHGAAEQGRCGMKEILGILLLAVVSDLIGQSVASVGLAIVAAVLLIGDLVQAVPESVCTQDCNQGDNCTCQPAGPGREP